MSSQGAPWSGEPGAIAPVAPLNPDLLIDEHEVCTWSWEASLGSWDKAIATCLGCEK